MSNKAKFTEGELIVEENEYSKEFEVHQKDSEDCFYVVAEGISNVSDAHLIAAAPDMYRMLGQLKTFTENMHSQNVDMTIQDSISLHKDVEKLLAKARGEI